VLKSGMFRQTEQIHLLWPEPEGESKVNIEIVCRKGNRKKEERGGPDVY